MFMLFDRHLTLTLKGTHFFWMIVVIGKCSVDIGDIEIMAVRNCPGIESSVFNLFFDEPDRKPPSFEMRLIV